MDEYARCLIWIVSIIGRPRILYTLTLEVLTALASVFRTLLLGHNFIEVMYSLLSTDTLTSNFSDRFNIPLALTGHSMYRTKCSYCISTNCR